MARTAMITGASSGLGAEYARQLAARGHDLVLVGRDRDALDVVAAATRGAHGIRTEALVADLTVTRQRDRVVRRLEDANHPVDLLVNNAGFGLPGAFENRDIDDEVRHLDLHVGATLRLVHAVLPGMLARGSGRILNVASVAGFVPRDTYGAAKAWVVSFSRWANATYAERGVTVTAVCPGFVRTDFHRRLGLAPGREGVPPRMWLTPPEVVAESLRDLARGRAVSIPSLRYKLLVAASRVLPARLVAKAARRGR